MLVTIIMDVKYEDQPIIRRNGEDELEVKSLQLWAKPTNWEMRSRGSASPVRTAETFGPSSDSS
jgi:hypothetical protein